MREPNEPPRIASVTTSGRKSAFEGSIVGEPDVDRGLDRAGPVDHLEPAAARRLRHDDGSRGALLPAAEGLADGLLHRGLVEAADHVDPRARGAVVGVVERPSLRGRVSLQHLVRRKETAVRVLGIEGRAELLEDELLRLRPRDRELPQAVVLQPRDFRVGELGIAGDVGNEPDRCRTEFGEHVRRDVRAVRADVHPDLAAHLSGLLGDLGGRARRRALGQEISDQVREPHLLRRLVHVARPDPEVDADLRDRSVLHEA